VWFILWIDWISVKLGFGWIMILGVLYCWPIECIFMDIVLFDQYTMFDLRNYCSWMGVLDS
jgi:hypothetical protein